MNVKDNDRKKNTDLVPIPPEPPAEDQKLRHLTDDEIIQGFRYLMNKDKKKDIYWGDGKTSERICAIIKDYLYEYK